VTARLGGVIALLAVLACALAALAAGESRSSAVEGSCGTETVTVLFWPRGHGAIPGLGFPAFRTPHAEVYAYQGAATYRSASFLGSADGKGKVELRPGCPRVRDHTTVQQLPATSLTRAAAVTCRTRNDTLVQLRKVPGAGVRAEVRLLEGPNRLVLRALVTGNAIGSNLAYNPQRCRVGRPPG
jgi:hypothetical protein